MIMSKNDSVLVITLRILDEINVGYVKSIRTDLRPSLRQNSYAEIHFHFQILQSFSNNVDDIVLLPKLLHLLS